MESLTLDLFAPGMSPIHRAGLGGLAATLHALDESSLAAAERPNGGWAVDNDRITLSWPKPESAGPFLEKLFGFAFQIKNGLIHLPGRVRGELPFAVRAELHEAIFKTFLQHGQTRKLAKKETERVIEIDEKPIAVRFKVCTSYKHQTQWTKLIDAKKRLTTKQLEIAGPLFPGAVVRHVGFTSQTRFTEGAKNTLALTFALVGCLSLRLHRGGVLIVPEVTDLHDFAHALPFITPTSPRECRISGVADAALQALVRLRTQEKTEVLGVPACRAVRFSVLPWAKQQKTRSASIEVLAEGRLLDDFSLVIDALPPRLRPLKSKGGRGKNKVETTKYFWADSVVRPFIAENVARGRRWYEGFRRLVVSNDLAKKVGYEREGLSTMVEELTRESGEVVIIHAVHEAMRRRYGAIAEETKNANKQTRHNRWNREYERRRLAFVGAKRADDFRYALANLLSHSGRLKTLQDGWTELLPWLRADRWQYARDLALIALASYKSTKPEPDQDAEEITEQGARE